MPEGQEQQGQEQQGQEQQGQEQQGQEQQGSEQQGAARRPEGIPDSLWSDTGFNADAFAQYRAPAADLPSAADGYTIPKVDGVEIDQADPIFSVLRTAAFDNGIGQEGFAGVVSSYANALKEADDARHTEQMGLLGANAQTRIDTVSTFLDGNLPADEAEALRGSLTDAKAVQGLERLMNRKAPAAQREGDPPAAQRETREEIRKMMMSKAYSGKAHERDPTVIKKVEEWFKEEARLEAEAAGKK